VTVPGLFRNAQHTLQVNEGDVIFRQGDAGDDMYGVISGRVQLQAGDKVIATLGPDEVFGEMAIIDSVPRMATAMATEDTALAVIDRRRFLFLVHETPTFALTVMSSLAARLRHDQAAPDTH